MDQIANLVIDLGIDAAEFKNEIPRIKNLLNGAASDAERSSARMQRFMERQTQAARQTTQAASSAATAASVHAQTVEKNAQAHERMAREVEKTRQRMEALSQKMREEQAQAMALAEAQDKAAAAFYRQIDSVKQASAGLQELQRIQQQIRLDSGLFGQHKPGINSMAGGGKACGHFADIGRLFAGLGFAQSDNAFFGHVTVDGRNDGVGRFAGQLDLIVGPDQARHHGREAILYQTGAVNWHFRRQCAVQLLTGVLFVYGFGKLDVENFNIARPAHGQRRSKCHLRMRAEALRIGYGQISSAQRPLHEALQVEVRNIAQSAGFSEFKQHSHLQQAPS